MLEIKMWQIETPHRGKNVVLMPQKLRIVDSHHKKKPSKKSPSLWEPTQQAQNNRALAGDGSSPDEPFCCFIALAGGSPAAEREEGLFVLCPQLRGQLWMSHFPGKAQSLLPLQQTRKPGLKTRWFSPDFLGLGADLL